MNWKNRTAEKLPCFALPRSALLCPSLRCPSMFRAASHCDASLFMYCFVPCCLALPYLELPCLALPYRALTALASSYRFDSRWPANVILNLSFLPGFLFFFRCVSFLTLRCLSVCFAALHSLRCLALPFFFCLVSASLRLPGFILPCPALQCRFALLCFALLCPAIILFNLSCSTHFLPFFGCPAPLPVHWSHFHFPKLPFTVFHCVSLSCFELSCRALPCQALLCLCGHAVPLFVMPCPAPRIYPLPCSAGCLSYALLYIAMSCLALLFCLALLCFALPCHFPS